MYSLLMMMAKLTGEFGYLHQLDVIKSLLPGGLRFKSWWREDLIFVSGMRNFRLLPNFRSL